VGTPLANLGANAGVLSIAGQLTGLMTVGNTREQLATLTERDVLVSPPLGDKVATGDFSKGPEALAIGLDGVNAVREQLARYSLTNDEFAAHMDMRVGHSSSPPVIEFVRLDNRTGYADEVLLSRLHVPLGKALDIDRLERELRAVYGFETMALVSYDLIHEDGRTGVLVHADPKVQGPNYLETGLSLSSDFAGEFDASLRAGMLIAPINAAGGEVRGYAQIGNEGGLLGEYYQPFGASQRYFFFTRGQYLDRTINQFNNAGDKLASYTGGEFRIAGAVGREFGNYGAALVGLRRAAGTANVLIGDPDLPDFDYDSGEAFVQLTVDRLDSFYFPRKGYFVRTDYNYSREKLGADSEFEQFNFDLIAAHPFGRHAIQGGVRYHVTVAGTAPVQSLYRLGGFSRLSGFLPNELSGQDYAILLGGYLYELGSVFNRGVYCGATAEYGNAWQQRSDMAFDDGIWNGSAYLGFDSWVGPVLFGYGLRQGGEGNIFLQIGKAF
jgi:NTE family protein